MQAMMRLCSEGGRQGEPPNVSTLCSERFFGAHAIVGIINIKSLHFSSNSAVNIHKLNDNFIFSIAPYYFVMYNIDTVQKSTTIKNV